MNAALKLFLIGMGIFVVTWLGLAVLMSTVFKGYM